MRFDACCRDRLGRIPLLTAFLLTFMNSQFLAAPASDSGSAPQRIITMAPSITECVFALGCGDRVVGVTTFCLYPPEAVAKPKCGGWVDPNFEVIAGLKPDLVIIQGAHEKVVKFCEQRAIRVLSVDINTLATLKQELMNLGRALNVEDRATSLCQAIDRDLEALRSTIPEEQRPRVFLTVMRTEGSLGALYTVGRGAFLDELLALVGGNNVFGDTTQLYFQASKEALLARRPDLIIELRPSERLDAARAAALRAEWSILPSIPAVQKNAIRFVTEDYVLMPGPRVAQSAAAIKKALMADAENGTPR